MAKLRMVTRTVEVHTFSVMCLNTETAEVSVHEYKLGNVYDKRHGALEVLKKQHETDTFKLVSIQSESAESVLYGMSEEDFIANAAVLPPRAEN